MPTASPSSARPTRPPSSAQHVANLTASNADRAHRFTRLWRHTPWQMWELDRLHPLPKVGNGTLDASALVRLRARRTGCRPPWASEPSNC